MRPSSNLPAARRPVAIAAAAPITRSTHFAPRPRQRIAGAMRNVVALLGRWRERARERAALARLDARLLRDIGVTRADAERECNKPFWRA